MSSNRVIVVGAGPVGLVAAMALAVDGIPVTVIEAHKDVADALRAAFDATIKDPAFIAEARTARLDLQPVSGEALQRFVADIVATPPAIVERLKTVLELK